MLDSSLSQPPLQPTTTGGIVLKTATNAMQQASVARTNLGRIWKFRHIYVFLLPAIVWYAIFCYYPMYGVLLAFKDYKFNLGILGSPWVGLKYFETFLTDSYFYIILKNTLAISLLKLICGFPAPILFALMINEVTHVKYKKVVQTLSYLPHFVSWVVVISLMQKLFSPYNGIVNDIRQMINPEAEAIFYLGEPAYFYPMVVGSDIWKGVGWGSIVYLAAPPTPPVFPCVPPSARFPSARGALKGRLRLRRAGAARPEQQVLHRVFPEAQGKILRALPGEDGNCLFAVRRIAQVGNVIRARPLPQRLE